ncbi:MAG: ABC transporter substrate-binding protein [Treponemataceae bacterium]|nr:ABC transporter substrate-binding protein [Treponemataceae bacterium]
MKKIKFTLCISCILFFALISLSAKENTNSPKSVVALSKSTAQMWVLAGGKLTGTTQDALELDKNAMNIGSLTTVNLESIILLKPDLVILTQDIPLHKKLSINLRELKIKTYIVDVKNFSDYENVMKDFTNLTGREDLYKKNVVQVKNEINSIIAKANAEKITAKSGTSPTYLLLRISATKNKVLKNHFANEIFQNLELVSCIDLNSALDEIGIEAIVSLNPDYIFIIPQGNEKKAMESFYHSYSKNPVWQNLKATKLNQVEVLPKDLFNFKPNEKWAEAYRYINEIIEK